MYINKYENRITWPDILRIISVFSVIMLHTAVKGFEIYGARTIEWQVCNFYNSCTRFCVPIFVMISGMFLLNPEKEYTIKTIFKKKLLRIALAFIFWSIFYAFIRIIGEIYHESNIKTIFLLFIERIITGPFHFWFLFMISGLYIVSPFLRLILKDKLLTKYYLVLCIIFIFLFNTINLFPSLSNILSKTINRMDIKLMSGFSSYFVLGYVLSTNNISKKFRRIVYIMGIFSLFLTIFINGYISYKLNVPGMWMYDNLSLNVFMMTISIFIFIMYNFKNIKMSLFFSKIIYILGKYSFGVYIIHIFLLSHMIHLGVSPFFCHPIISIPITSFIIFIISYIIIYFIGKVPIMNKYII